MTLQKLKDEIDYIYEYYDNPDKIVVKIGIQQNYPLRAKLSNICTKHGDTDEKDEIWLAISDGIDYGVPRAIWTDSDIYSNED